MRLVACLILIAISPVTVRGAILTGSFVAGSGNWTTVSNGGFETGNTSGWTNVVFTNGNWKASNTYAYNGMYSVRADTTTTFVSPGYGLQRSIGGLIVGQEYVLSGFFYTGDATGGATYLDLSDINPDTEPGAASGSAVTYGVDQWQFAYKSFVAQSTSVNLRIVRDGRFGTVNQGEYVYIDEVAITKAIDFAAPEVEQTVAEPATMTIWGLGALGCALGAYRRRRKQAA